LQELYIQFKTSIRLQISMESNNGVSVSQSAQIPNQTTRHWSFTGISFKPFFAYPSSGGTMTLLCTTKTEDQVSNIVKRESPFTCASSPYLSPYFHPLGYHVHSRGRLWRSLCGVQPVGGVREVPLSLFSRQRSDSEHVRLLEEDTQTS
jgi:hypothetical protein